MIVQMIIQMSHYLSELDVHTKALYETKLLSEMLAGSSVSSSSNLRTKWNKLCV